MKRLGLILVLLPCVVPAQTLKTRWAATVTPENVWREYPRPQMMRKDWVNLNGLWNLTIVSDTSDGTRKASFAGKVLVPFPVESQLSRVHRFVKPADTLVYERTFARPKGDRVLLHFGASDWSTQILVNGKQVGSHVGGYDPFTVDITDALNPAGDQRLQVNVTDPSDSNWQPRGKQVLKPGGIFYTPTSGIWQTVWLEAVPNHSIDSLQVQADIDGTLRVAINTRTAPGAAKLKSFFTVTLRDRARAISGQAVAGGTAVLRVPRPKVWSPTAPTLYPLEIKWAGDRISSYCAFRRIGLTKEKQPRIALNGKPIFLVGPLDQGFWPDGIYTPPSDSAMKYDLEVTKRLGFNMIRKHVKVEPDRWYYWCDKLGICVLQDMPSGDKFIGPSDPDIDRSPESAHDFEAELKALVETHCNHPSIVTWVLYNEGWGQWDTARMTQQLRQWDPTRLIDSVTGWAGRAGVGDYSDWHVYPGPGAPPNEGKRAIFLGEFGGLGLPVPGHMWQEKGWGYQSFKTSEELTNRFVDIFRDLRFLQAKGLSGAVYTQTTDCETELNGLMTYDRSMIKMDEVRVRKAVRDLSLPPPTVETVVPAADTKGQIWRYTFEAPAPSWMATAFDDRGWIEGQSGFGTPETPGAIPRTRWDTHDIWLRRQFVLSRNYASTELYLRLSHDDDVEVYLDNKPVYSAAGWTTSYKLIYLGRALAKGEHTIAIHCHQNQGGQYVDAGLVRIKQSK